MSNITLNEFKDLAKHLIKNNEFLRSKGERPITLGIEGSCGIGKSAILQQIADELDMRYVRINLSELEEVSDLTGFPIKEFETVDGEWIPADLVGKYCDPEKFTSNTRMSYAAPAWLPDPNDTRGVILNLDDYTRANTLFMQATMQLIQDGKFISWKLPENTNIVLSSNPDDGTYQVSSLDPAQRSRFINFPVKFDVNEWSQWAEFRGIEGRGINFCLSYADELFKPENELIGINARSYTMFINAISSIQDWSRPESLGMILNIAQGCFNDKDNIVGNLFTTFIANKLDKLISPEDMLFGDWDTIKEKMEKCVYDGDRYRTPIASVLQTRLLNKSLAYFSEKGNKTDVVIDRIVKIIDADKMLLSEDFLFNIIKTLYAKFPQKMTKALLNGRIRDIVLS